MHECPMEQRRKSYFSNQLHVTIFDTVVDHLDIVSGAFVTNPIAARLIVVTLGGNALENVLDVRPCLLVSTRHQARTVASTFFTTGDTCSNETEALLRQVFGATVGIGEMRVTTVDDDVTGFDVGKDGLDEVVDWLTSHDEQHDTTGLLQLGAELRDGVRTDNRLAWEQLDLYGRHKRDVEPKISK